MGSLDFGNMNLGHVFLIEKEYKKAFETYKSSIEHFEDKKRFFEGYDDDFQYLEKYGISEKKYAEMKNELLKIN